MPSTTPTAHCRHLRRRHRHRHHHTSKYSPIGAQQFSKLHTYFPTFNIQRNHGYDICSLLPDHLPEVCGSIWQWSLACDVMLGVFSDLYLNMTGIYVV